MCGGNINIRNTFLKYFLLKHTIYRNILTYVRTGTHSKYFSIPVSFSYLIVIQLYRMYCIYVLNLVGRIRYVGTCQHKQHNHQESIKAEKKQIRIVFLLTSTIKSPLDTKD